MEGRGVSSYSSVTHKLPLGSVHDSSEYSYRLLYELARLRSCVEATARARERVKMQCRERRGD